MKCYNCNLVLQKYSAITWSVGGRQCMQFICKYCPNGSGMVVDLIIPDNTISYYNVNINNEYCLIGSDYNTTLYNYSVFNKPIIQIEKSMPLDFYKELKPQIDIVFNKLKSLVILL